MIIRNIQIQSNWLYLLFLTTRTYKLRGLGSYIKFKETLLEYSDFQVIFTYLPFFEKMQLILLNRQITRNKWKMNFISALDAIKLAIIYFQMISCFSCHSSCEISLIPFNISCYYNCQNFSPSIVTRLCSHFIILNVLRFSLTFMYFSWL